MLVSTLAISSTKSVESKSFADPYACWNAADAAEVYTCGYVGCNFGLWDAVFNACMGNQQ